MKRTISKIRPLVAVTNDGYDGKAEPCRYERSVASSPLHHEEEFSSTDPIIAPASNEFSSDCSLKTEEWLTSEEAANFLRISVKALRNMASNGQVPFYKLGSRNRYRKDELEALLLSQKRGKYGNQD